MSASSAQSDPRWKFTVEDVMGMVRAGILRDDDRVELLEGDLFPMSPQDPQHAAAIRRVRAALSSAYGPGFVIDVQSPLHASNHSLPEPDVMVLRGGDSTFDHRHPRGEDCVLVVEVTLSSDARDRRKAGIYAASLVPVYWRLDLVTRSLAVHEQPDALASGYALVRSLDESAEAQFPGSLAGRVKVTDLLPPTR
jgi:Uma2 family endonuclease